MNKYVHQKKLIRSPRATRIIPAVWQKFNIPAPVPEYQFCIDRKWRIDYAWPELTIALEIEGGIWTRGRHITPTGFIKDLEKYNRLAQSGWLLLRYEPRKLDFFQVKKTIDNQLYRIKGKSL